MSYQVLARKWRPHSFKDLVGQEYIVRMLSNALTQKRLHHAYLLTGTRGIGKTTIARILAKCLNCDQGVTATPCDACGTCLAIDAGKFLDLFEIDAASRTKVEDTREILDNVPYPPSQGRYKVYLIDEVHMLSNHSFNALLKTLEEPPEHVKFILATTDPKKLPITILSRCLQFHLKRILPEQISQHLAHICAAENISFEAPALQKIAVAADGSMRDALSLLDQAIAYGNGSVQQTDVNQMLGSVAQADLMPFLHALAIKDNSALLASLQHLIERAPDFNQLLEALISLLHQLAMQQIAAISHDESIIALASQISAADIQLYYQIALLGRRDLSICPSPQQGFEMIALRMLAFTPTFTPTATPNKVAPKVAVSKPAAASAPTPAEPVMEPAQADATQAWCDIVPKLGLSGMAQALASNSILASKVGTKINLALSANHQPLLNPKSQERLQAALSQFFAEEVTLTITLAKETLETTPTHVQQQQREDKLSQTKAKTLQDPQIKKLIEMYDASLEVSLINT